MIRVKDGKSVLCTHFRVATMATTRRKKEREGGKGGEGWRECYLGDVRVKSLCCSRCYPVSPFQESRIMRSIVPECCFCGRYGSSCATSYSWNVFAYSLVRISTSLPALFYLSRVKARMSKLQNTNYRPIFKTRISTSILARRLIGIFGKYRWCWTRLRSKNSQFWETELKDWHRSTSTWSWSV